MATAGRGAPHRELLNLADLRVQSSGIRIGLPRDERTRAYVLTAPRGTSIGRSENTPETRRVGRYLGGRPRADTQATLLVAAHLSRR